jgi:hypothetical protein
MKSRLLGEQNFEPYGTKNSCGTKIEPYGIRFVPENGNENLGPKKKIYSEYR